MLLAGVLYSTSSCIFPQRPQFLMLNIWNYLDILAMACQAHPALVKQV